jgi:hypothetical protein
MSIYWKRRIAVLLILMMTLFVIKKADNTVKEYLDNDWACKHLMVITVQKDMTLSEIVEQQITNGNCQGYEGLLAYLVEKNSDYGSIIYPGETITIDSYGSDK